MNHFGFSAECDPKRCRRHDHPSADAALGTPVLCQRTPHSIARFAGFGFLWGLIQGWRPDASGLTAGYLLSRLRRCAG